MSVISSSASYLDTDRGAPRRASNKSEFVFLGMPDLNGSIRGKALRPEAFKAALREGVPMTDLLLALDPTDSPITDYDEFGIRAGAGDLIFEPDPDTLRELSWRQGWQVCLATPFWADGTRCELSSREVLRGALVAMSELGYEVKAALEYEIRIRDRNGQLLSSGISYSGGEIQRFDELVRLIVPALEALRVDLIAVHTEAAPGLLELNIAFREGLQAADDATLVKFAVKEVAASIGLSATFLAKLTQGEEGSSGHIHLSCWSEGRNAFASPDQSDSLPSPLAGAIAGVVEHLPGASLLLNPTINSYKRLVPGYFAPTNASWGLENRSTAVRVIRSERPERCRIECRRPGADANPYLALAALVASAADGISRNTIPPPPVAGDAYARADLQLLPTSLESALRAFQADVELRRALGERFSDYFAISRQWELKAWQQAVSEWERRRYEAVV